MKHTGGDVWFTAAELAEEALPGLPKTKRKINEDWAPRWALQVDANGHPLARKRKAVGGGLEFHVSVLTGRRARRAGQARPIRGRRCHGHARDVDRRPVELVRKA